MNIGLSVLHHAVRHPDRIAVDDDGKRQVTYRELHARSNRFAHLLEARGVRSGDRVAVIVVNKLELIEMLVGCAMANVMFAPLNFRLSEADLRSILENCQPRLIVCDDDLADMVRELGKEVGAEVLTMSDYDAELAGGSASLPSGLYAVEGRSPLLMQYTSGTTGLPKGATFTHDAVAAHAGNVVIEYGFHDLTRTMVCIPHNSAYNIQIIPALVRGSAIVLTDPRSFDGARWLERINTLGVTSSQVVPTMLYRALEAYRRSPSGLETVECLGYGSAPMPPERVEELLGVFGNVFVQLYGMIEIAAIGTMLRPAEHEWALAHAPEVLGSVGQSSFGMHVRVVDDAGADVEPGQRGEIVFKSSYMMTEYYRRPDLTKETIRDGWLHSGDIGEQRDGWLYLVDRKKDIIIRGGQNIASKEVEDAIATHPAVMEVAVVGVPSDEWGEDIVATVIVRNGENIAAEDVVAACRDAGLARFKTPARVEFVDELPRNAIGKVQKARLRAAYGPKR